MFNEIQSPKNLIIISIHILILYLNNIFMYWATKFKEVCFSHVNRGYNKKAQNLAQYGSIRSSFSSNCLNPPSWIAKPLYSN